MRSLTFADVVAPCPPPAAAARHCDQFGWSRWRRGWVPPT